MEKLFRILSSLLVACFTLPSCLLKVPLSVMLQKYFLQKKKKSPVPSGRGSESAASVRSSPAPIKKKSKKRSLRRRRMVRVRLPEYSDDEDSSDCSLTSDLSEFLDSNEETDSDPQETDSDPDVIIESDSDEEETVLEVRLGSLSCC